MQPQLRTHLGLRAMVETGTMSNTGSVDRPVPIHNPTSESYYVLRTSYYRSAPPHPAEIRSAANLAIRENRRPRRIADRSNTDSSLRLGIEKSLGVNRVKARNRHV